MKSAARPAWRGSRKETSAAGALSVTRASSELPMSFDSRAFSSSLRAFSRTPSSRSMSATKPAGADLSRSEGPGNSPRWTEASLPSKAGTWAQASSAVNDRIGAMSRSESRRIVNMAVWAERRSGAFLAEQ